MKSKWFWDNIYLSRDERTSTIFLVGVLFIFILIKVYMVRFYQPVPLEIDAEIIASITYEEEAPSYEKKISKEEKDFSGTKSSAQKRKFQRRGKASKISTLEPKTFDFNPNTLSKDSLKMLGLSRYTVNSLLKYRSKGGKINTKEQFNKFNGLDKSTIEKLANHIKLPVSRKKAYKKKDFTVTKADTNQLVRSKYKKKQPRIIDINSADTTDFMNLYGIGKVYSKRIIAYRNSLGGFFEIDQIKEVWGISDSLYKTLVPYLNVDPVLIQKRNINEMTKEELGRHKYVGWFKSKMITAYKNSHGDYKSMEDFKKLHALTNADVDTLKIYFDVK